MLFAIFFNWYSLFLFVAQNICRPLKMLFTVNCFLWKAILEFLIHVVLFLLLEKIGLKNISCVYIGLEQEHPGVYIMQGIEVQVGGGGKMIILTSQEKNEFQLRAAELKFFGNEQIS